MQLWNRVAARMLPQPSPMEPLIAALPASSLPITASVEPMQVLHPSEVTHVADPPSSSSLNIAPTSVPPPPNIMGQLEARQEVFLHPQPSVIPVIPGAPGHVGQPIASPSAPQSADNKVNHLDHLPGQPDEAAEESAAGFCPHGQQWTPVPLSLLSSWFRPCFWHSIV